jgi:hypothetical protein
LCRFRPWVWRLRLTILLGIFVLMASTADPSVKAWIQCSREYSRSISSRVVTCWTVWIWSSFLAIRGWIAWSLVSVPP